MSVKEKLDAQLKRAAEDVAKDKPVVSPAVGEDAELAAARAKPGVKFARRTNNGAVLETY